MKCPYCRGRGIVVTGYGDIFKCNICHGTGNIEPLTNEEWFDCLSTKEKAKWLSKQSQFIYDCVRKGCTPKIMYEEDWEYWLKEKHDEM